MEWHDEFQVWLTETQSLENSQLVIDYLYSENYDWSKEAISALLGNMRHESSVNPNMYEYGYKWEDNRGYGLVQWTPRSKYWDWAVANGYDPEKGGSQLARIDYEVKNNIQWIPIEKYGNMTFTQFRTNSGNWSVDYLTEAFTWCYERPRQDKGEESMPARKSFANKVYNELVWNKEGGVDGNVIEIINNGKLEILAGVEKAFQDLETPDTSSLLNDLFKPQLFKNSQNYYSNKYIKATLIMNNFIKLNPTNENGFDIDIDGLLSELLKDVTLVINNGFDDIISSIGSENPSSKPAYPTLKELEITSPYGWRINPITNEQEFHASIDIGGKGQERPLYATQDGVIYYNQSTSYGGWTIRIEHTGDKFFSQYQHMAVQSPLAIGTIVKKGDVVGTMGSTGDSTGIHLDFQICKEKNNGWFTESGTIDPEIYLGLKSPVVI